MIVNKAIKLTKTQQQKVVEYRKRYWHQIISTKPANRKCAEKSARQLAKIVSTKISRIVWVMSPEEGRNMYENICPSPDGFSWRPQLRAVTKILETTLSTSFRASSSLSIRTSLGDLLWNSLWKSTWYSLEESLVDSLHFWLRNSFYSSLLDSGWLAYYSYAIKILGMECDSDTQNILALFNKTVASCLALWFASETVILCERPETVQIEDGRLISLSWRKQ